MTALVWDKPDERTYERGIDRGVIYISDKAVPWNGLISVKETEVNTSVVKSKFENLTYFNTRISGFFQATITAFNYPVEFLKALGEPMVQPGFIITGQQKQRFSFSYRTMVNDKDYKIHIVYNALISPLKRAYQTIDRGINVSRYEWQIDCTPPEVSNLSQPTAHMIIDSRTTQPEVLDILETILYGTDETDPQLVDQVEILGYFDGIFIELHEDGTYTVTAYDYGDKLTMLDEEVAEFTYRYGEWLNTDTYSIKTNRF